MAKKHWLIGTLAGALALPTLAIAGDEPKNEEGLGETTSEKHREAREDAPTVYDDSATGGSGLHESVTIDGQQWDTESEPMGDEPQINEKNQGTGGSGSNVEADADVKVIPHSGTGGSGQAGQPSQSGSMQQGQPSQQQGQQKNQPPRGGDAALIGVTTITTYEVIGGTITGTLANKGQKALTVRDEDGTQFRLKLAQDVKIKKNGKEVSKQELKEGAPVRASFAIQGDDNVLTNLEVLPKQGGSHKKK